MQIFLSYRRDDAAAWAGRLRDALAARFGDDSIFQDVVAIGPGRNFADAIEAAIMRSDVAIAVIGPGWLTASGPDGERRLEQPDDYVRSELLAAFAHTTLVIPVLVGGAAMPSSAQLPGDLRPLGLLQAVTLHDATWHQDVEGLIRALTDKSTSLWRRWQVAVSAVVVGVLAVGGIAWLLVDQRDPDGSLINGETSSTTSGSSETQPGRVNVTVRCETPQGPEWTELGVTGETQLADGLNFEVVNGYSRMEESGQWLVVLRTEVTNTLPAWSQTHSSWFYRLVAEGTGHMPSCFGVTGQNPIGPGASSEVLVGFEIPIDPERPLAVDLDTGGVFGSIDLTPSEGTG